MKRVLFLGAWAALLLLLSAAYFHRPAFALALEEGVALPLRRSLGALSSLFPFSLTALTLTLLPFAFLFLLLCGLRACEQKGGLPRFLSRLLSAALLLSTLFLLTFAPAYHRPPIEEEWGLPSVTARDREAALARLSALAEGTLLPSDSAASSPPSDSAALSTPLDSAASSAPMGGAATAAAAALSEAARSLASRYPLPACVPVSPKLLLQGESFSRLDILGLYAFPFCEITVSGDCPADTLLFTLSHEAAHALGRMREEEADLLGFALCLESGDTALAAAGARGILSRLPEGERSLSLVTAYLKAEYNESRSQQNEASG